MLSEHTREQPQRSDARLEEKTSGFLRARVPQDILEQAQDGRLVVEDFRPLAESLEWEIGQRYWRERGSMAFSGDASPVPFVVNNDGALSCNAAEILFESLREAEKDAPLPAKIFVLELGIGVGVFARLFLNSFQQLCAASGKDYYDRLVYVAADRSDKMLLDACRNGIFSDHRGHYLLRVVDALQPREYLGGDGILPSQPPFFHAVFLNYLLDCLPCTHLKVADNDVRQLHVRTCLARNVNLGDFTNLKPDELLKHVRSHRRSRPQTLVDVYDLFATEYSYRPVEGEVPYRDFVYGFAKEASPSFLLNYGAIQCLEKLTEIITPGGFVLINDYGQAEVNRSEDFEHQRFSGSTAVGVHFGVLKAYFGKDAAYQWIEPNIESDRIFSRMLGKRLHEATVLAFRERMGKERNDWLAAPWNRARGNIQYGRFEAAISAYHQALERQPLNWFLMNEIANFLVFTLRNPSAGIEMAKAAVRLNPRCSAQLWNTLGDAYFQAGLYADSRRAFLQAIKVNPGDVTARYNLVWIHMWERDFLAALNVIAEALALDEHGQYYEKLVNKQTEILNILGRRNQFRQLLLANRFSRRASDVAPSSSNHEKD